MENSIKGTIFKLNVHMKPIDGYHLADIDWEADVYAPGSRDNKHIIVKKDDAIKVDEDNYKVVVDSAIGGAGEYELMLTSYIPDADCPNGTRVEKKRCKTDVEIVP